MIKLNTEILKFLNILRKGYISWIPKVGLPRNLSEFFELQQLNQMDLKKTTSNRWVDYSGTQSERESSDSDTERAPKPIKKQQKPKPRTSQPQPTNKGNRQYQEPQFRKQSSHTHKQIPIDDIKLIEGEFAWLLVQFYVRSREAYDQVREKLENLKNQNPSIRLYKTKRNQDGSSSNTSDLYVPKQMALKFIKSGLAEDETRLKFTLHPRNFQRDRGERRGDRGDRGDRRDDRGERRGGRGRRGGGRGGRHERNYNEDDRQGHRDDRNRRGQDRRKPVYVDKQTGKKSDNKKKFDERVIQESNRQYSKKRAYELGDQLASFRNKRKQSEEPPINQSRQSSQHEEPQKIQQQTYVAEKKQQEPWKRKAQNHIEQQKLEKIENKIQEEKPAQEAQKQVQGGRGYQKANQRYDKSKPYQNGRKQKKKYVAKDKNNETKEKDTQAKEKKPSIANQNSYREMQNMMDSDHDDE